MLFKLIVCFLLVGFVLFITLGVELYSRLTQIRNTEDDINKCFKDVKK